MNPPSQDIAEILDNAGILSSGEDVYYSTMPDGVLPCISVHDTGGFEPDAAIDYYKPTVQVRFRAVDYDSAYALAALVLTTLHALYEQTVNSTRYIAIWAMSDILQLGQDENKNHLLSLNFRIHRTTT